MYSNGNRKQAKNNDVFPDADSQASDVARKAEIPHGVSYTKYDSMVADYFSDEHEDMRKSVPSTSNAVDEKAKTNRMRDEEFKRAAEEDGTFSQVPPWSSIADPFSPYSQSSSCQTVTFKGVVWWVGHAQHDRRN